VTNYPNTKKRGVNMSDDTTKNEIIAAADSEIVSKKDQGIALSDQGIALSDQEFLDTTGLTDSQIQELRMQHNKGLIDLKKKALELNIDIKALDATLSTMGEQTSEVSKAGDSVTMSHTQDSELGRTEVMMGNTDAAGKGKLTKTQTGEKDNTLIYVGIAAVVIVIFILASN